MQEEEEEKGRRRTTRPKNIIVISPLNFSLVLILVVVARLAILVRSSRGSCATSELLLTSIFLYQFLLPMKLLVISVPKEYEGYKAAISFLVQQETKVIRIPPSEISKSQKPVPDL